MNLNIQNNDQRIKFLLYKIKNKTATQEEQKEYIELMRTEEYITQEEYEKYQAESKKPTSDIGEFLVGLGLAVLIGTLLSDLFKSKK